MKLLTMLLMAGLCVSTAMRAQSTFTVTGTEIPSELLKLNYGPMPKGVEGLDLNICNVTDARHPITSSAIFQALSEAQTDLRPIGRDIMLAAILRNQNRSLKTWLSLGLGSTTSLVSVLGPGHGAKSAGVLSATALAAVIGQQLLATWSPVLTADQVEKFEAQVLEPALVMDGGSCVERTVFTAILPAPKKAAAAVISNFEFHVR